MRIVLGYITVAVFLASPACWGQGLFDHMNFRDTESKGFGIYGASVFYGYSKYARSTTGQVPSNSNYGGSFSVGWQNHRLRTNSSILYSGQYGGLVSYPEFNRYSHSLTLSSTRQISPKWTGTLSASGQDYSLSQSLFQPSSLAVTTQMISSFNDFAAAFGLGQFSTSQIQSLFQNVFLESALRSGLLGRRALTYGGQASLSYSPSQRWRIWGNAVASGGQPLGDSGSTGAAQNFVIPRSLGGGIGIGYSHSLSPRTQVGLDLSETYYHNYFQEAIVSAATASFGRKMGSRWFLRVYGGGSYSAFLQGSSRNLLQATGGGSLGFQMLTHTLAATYDRGAISGYGSLVGTNTVFMGSWNWHRRGGRLSLFSNFSQQQQRNTGFSSLSGWQAAAGFSEILSAQTAVSVQYTYLDSTVRYPANDYNLKTNGVRISLNWSPRPLVR